MIWFLLWSEWSAGVSAPLVIQTLCWQMTYCCHCCVSWHHEPRSIMTFSCFDCFVDGVFLTGLPPLTPGSPWGTRLSSLALVSDTAAAHWCLHLPAFTTCSRRTCTCTFLAACVSVVAPVAACRRVLMLSPKISSHAKSCEGDWRSLWEVVLLKAASQSMKDSHLQFFILFEYSDVFLMCWCLSVQYY